VSKPELGDLAPAKRGQPGAAGQQRRRHGKGKDEQNADQEGGQRHAEQREHQQTLRDQPLAAQGGVHAKGYANAKRNQCGGAGELERCGHALLQQGRHLPALAIADAELALDRIAHEAEELKYDRLVEAQLLA
jgi:hypothetical protein